MLPRPRIRLPLWGALAIVVAAYLVRSASRGFDFRPDLPSDAVALLLLVLVLGAVAWLRRQPPADEPGAGTQAHDDEEPGR